ncbi:hypothetical protein [Roseomonas chloroacetimidivorans]|uniref:hypothetical protein n=1 Tax=Roseomonas chloroacetimidivorans TaxID=1766656 RepID=UPI003C72D7BA
MANARTRRRKECRKRQRAALAAMPLAVVPAMKRAKATRRAEPQSAGPKHERPPVIPWPTEGVAPESPEYAAAAKLRGYWDAAVPGLSGAMGHPSCAGFAADPKGWQGELDKEAAKAAANAWRCYNEAMDALARSCGRHHRDLVWHAVIEDVGTRHPPTIREGLKFLAEFWGM